VSDSIQQTLLIVRRRPSADAATEAVLRQLADFGLEVYTTRQRLTGTGLVHLASGPRVEMEERAAVLQQGGFRTWVIAPSPPQVAVERLMGIELVDGEMQLRTQQGVHVLRPGMQAVGVLAELTGALETRLVNRLRTNQLYRGTVASTAFDEKEIRRTILMNTPVFDLFLLDGERVSACIRAWPGRFDPKGLGAEAGVSSRANFELLIRQVAAIAKPFALHTHFGLSHLPGCKLTRESEGADWKDRTLRSLTRFGWLMVDIARQPQRRSASETPVSVGRVAAATLLGAPALAAAGVSGSDSHLDAIAATIDEALSETTPDQPDSPAATVSTLPPPPMPPDAPRFSLRLLLSAVGAALFFAISNLHSFGFVHRLGFSFARLLWSGLENGLFPGIACLALFAFGFNRFRLKRLIENTPTSRIRSLAMGLVEVHGYARRKYALVAPMTQSPCVWYRLRSYRKHGDSWRLVSDTHSGHVPFLLEDATGRVTVDPAGALMKAGRRSEGSADQASLMFGLGSSSNEKWVEDSIGEGEALYVLGSAAALKGQGKSLQQRKIERLRELKTDRNALAAYDRNGDGRIDEQEWQSAREAVEDQVTREHLAEKVTPQRTEETAVIGRSPHRSHPFVIAAARSEAHLTSTYTWLSSLQLCGSLLFFVWTLIAVFRYVG